VKGEH